MGKPSPQHETRVDILNAVAVLAGYTVPSRITDDLTPDVVRLDLRHRRLFVADAKETETPGTRHTQDRLRAYMVAMRAWLLAEYTVRLAICHGDYDSAGPWLFLLRTIARDAALLSSKGDSTVLDRDHVLCWVDLSIGLRADAVVSVKTMAASRRQRRDLRGYAD
ncbi:hypothetical protein GCM10023096_82560 [Nonomuraea ferruginea]